MKPLYTVRGVVLSKAPLRQRSTAPSAQVGAHVRVGRQVAGRSGRGVTVISGLALAADELEALASRLKRLCGAGGRVVRRAPAQNPSFALDRSASERDGLIEIQGEHRDRLVEELRRLGYDAKRAGG